jgi:hypothetical protein
VRNRRVAALEFAAAKTRSGQLRDDRGNGVAIVQPPLHAWFALD